ncbi:MAG: DALR domain-containing protein [Bacteroidota bacterium]
MDIHGGGLENQFPHHECEIAQSEAVTGRPFVKYWVHNNMVTVNGQKMGKSLGNFTTLKDAFAKFDPLVVRFFILQSHYRSTLDFSDEALQGAGTGLEKLLNTVRNLRSEFGRTEHASGPVPIDLKAYAKRIREAMDDDFNTPQAIAVLFDLSREVNTLLNAGKNLQVSHLKAIDAFFREFGGTVLGIIPDEVAPGGALNGNLEAGLVRLLIDIRTDVRTKKLWDLSDIIRDRLKELGIGLEDKKEGTVWRKL